MRLAPLIRFTKAAALISGALIAFLSLQAVAQDSPVLSIFSFEDTSCGAWVKSTDNEFARAQYGPWFRGFVSGYNFGNPNNQVALDRMPNNETLYLYVDKYCREHPLNPFVHAAFSLVEELREHPTSSTTRAH